MPSPFSEFACSSPRCPVCDGVFKQVENRLECQSCDRVFAVTDDGVMHCGSSPMLDYPEEARDYFAALEERSFWFRHRNQALQLMLERYCSEKTIWDVGAGNGYQSAWFQAAGYRMIALEPSMAGCRHAARRGVKTVICASLEELALPEKSVPTLFLLDVLEHIADPISLLTECRRVLKPGGHLMLTVPAFPLLWTSTDDYACHHRRYTRRSLSKELTAAQFHAEYFSGLFSLFTLPTFFLRAIPWRLAGRRMSRISHKDYDVLGMSGVRGRVLDVLLARELARLRDGKHQRLGTSLLAVASA